MKSVNNRGLLDKRREFEVDMFTYLINNNIYFTISIIIVSTKGNR